MLKTLKSHFALPPNGLFLHPCLTSLLCRHRAGNLSAPRGKFPFTQKNFPFKDFEHMFQVFEHMFQVFERMFQVFERKIYRGADKFLPRRKGKSRLTPAKTFPRGQARHGAIPWVRLSASHYTLMVHPTRCIRRTAWMTISAKKSESSRPLRPLYQLQGRCQSTCQRRGYQR